MGSTDKPVASMSRSLGICCLTYLLLSIPAFLITGNGIQVAMVWNLFLAFLPLVFAELARKNLGRAKPIAVMAIGLAWMLFFPNSPYMITDFIHISGTEFYTRANVYAPIVYSMEVSSWVKLLHIGLGALLGTLTGLLSLYLMHHLILTKKGKITAHCFVVGVSLLSGYAIYIGRFLRLNSWDIFRPISLLARLVSDFGTTTMTFSLLFAGYTLACYWVFYSLFAAKTH